MLITFQILNKNQEVIETVEDGHAWIAEQGEGPFFMYDEGIWEQDYIKENDEVRVVKEIIEE